MCSKEVVILTIAIATLQLFERWPDHAIHGCHFSYRRLNLYFVHHKNEIPKDYVSLHGYKLIRVKL